MLFLAAAMTMSLGWALIAALWPRDLMRTTLLLRCVLAAGLGSGISSLIYFAKLICLGGGQSHAVLFGETSCLAALVFFGWSRRRRLEPGQQPKRFEEVSSRWVVALFVMLLGLAIYSFVTSSITRPHGEGDAIAIWNLRARLLFDSGVAWRQAFAPEFAGTHPDYPLLIPGLIARTWEYVGLRSVAVPAAIGFGFTFGTVALLWTALRALGRQHGGWLAAGLLLGSPVYIAAGASQYADVPLSFFFLAATTLLCLHQKRSEIDRPLVYLAGFALGLGAWTKNEGLLFLLVVPVCHAWSMRRGGRRVLLAELGALALGASPALLALIWFKMCLVPQNDLLARLTIDAVLERSTTALRYQEIAGAFLQEIWALEPAVLVVLVYIVLAHRRCRVALCAIPAFMLVGHFTVYLLMSASLSWHLATSLPRLFQQLLPLVLFAAFNQRRVADSLAAKRYHRRNG